MNRKTYLENDGNHISCGSPKDAGATSVKELIPEQVVEIFQGNKHFNRKLLELDSYLFTKLFGKQITIFTKKREKLPYYLQNSLLANAVDRRDKKNTKEFKRTVITLGISYQNTIDRLFILVVKTYLSRQLHKLSGYLETVKEELTNKNGHSVTQDGNNVINHKKNLKVVEQLIKFYNH